jgi:hypothetical protein
MTQVYKKRFGVVDEVKRSSFGLNKPIEKKQTGDQQEPGNPKGCCMC